MKSPYNVDGPWSLHFDHDGTEDIAIIVDCDGDDLARSREFWRPEQGDPVVPTLAAMQLMVTAPKLLAALERAEDILRRVQDGHTTAWLGLPAAAEEARNAIAEAKGGRS
jgi:hypothetical protein